jgi:ankyrin repeat protein
MKSFGEYIMGKTTANSKIMPEILKYAKDGDIDKVKELLAAGANVDYKDIYGNTALDFAEKNGFTDMVKLLKSNGAVSGAANFKIDEDSKGTLTKEGDNLISRFVNIKNVSTLVTDEMSKFDKENGNRVVSRSTKVTWYAKSDFNHIEIHFDAVSKDVQINGEEKGNVNYTGVITINPISSEIKSTIEVK